MESNMQIEIKKGHIIKTCKKLFYEKGYRETTYEDICEGAGVTVGTITYHLTGKRNLAMMVFSEYEEHHRSKMEHITGGRYDLRTLTSLRILRWWHRVATDSGIRQFVTELCEEGIARSVLINHIEYVFQMLVLEYDLYISEKKLKFIASSHVGMTCELVIGMTDHHEIGDANEIADFIIESMFKSLDTDYITIRDLIKRAHEIHDTLESDKDYFAYFRYSDQNATALTEVQ